MKDFFNSLQPATKRETLNTLITTAIFTAIMMIVFVVLHLIWPDSVPFDYKVVLGGIAGAMIAVLNFFLMCLTVQRIAAEEDKDRAAKIMKLSYTRRYLMQLAWIAAAVLVPCFNLIAGICPLLFPGLGIKLRGTLAFRYVFRDKTPAGEAPGSAASDSAVSGGEAPGSAASDGSVSGGEAPGSAASDGSVSGGAVSGGTVPGDAAPDGADTESAD